VNNTETEAENGQKSTPATQDIPTQENSLIVDISDALSEKDRVKFTVHTRTTLPVSFYDA
jgi:sorting nexin-5/6/32